MSVLISPHAVIDPKACLGKNVSVGPFTFIGPNVEIGDGTVIGSNVVIKGPTTIGKDNTIYQFSSVGEDTQDLKYNDEPTRLEIGDRNTIREFVSIHRGTVQDQGLTKIGNDNLFITYSHVAHDCMIGNHVIVGHHVGLAGHVKIDDHAIVSGYSGVHQFCRIGAYSFLARATMLVKDVPPYVLVAGGNDAQAVNINAEGLKRHGFSSDAIATIKRAYKTLYRQGLLLDDAKTQLKASDSKEVQLMVDFIEQSERGILR